MMLFMGQKSKPGLRFLPVEWKKKKNLHTKMCSFISQFRKRRATVERSGFAPHPGLKKPKVTLSHPPHWRKEQNNLEHF